jgi:hypothetical protein
MGPRLGALLRAARGSRSPAEIAAALGVPLDDLVAAVTAEDTALTA